MPTSITPSSAWIFVTTSLLTELQEAQSGMVRGYMKYISFNVKILN